MNDKETGGPAFPTEPRGPIHGKDYDGMTLRDWFAGQALAGFTSGHDASGQWAWETKDAARNAYIVADAMLEARK